MRFPNPGGFGMFGGIFSDILAGLVFIICFVIVVGLLVVLVRFLWIATRAAEIYIANNSSSQPTTDAAVAAPVAATPTPAARAAAAPATTTTATKPVPTKPTPTTPRAPKADAK
jgi:predicted lipid-binding transport protein (Tim44 family)